LGAESVVDPRVDGRDDEHADQKYACRLEFVRVGIDRTIARDLCRDLDQRIRHAGDHPDSEAREPPSLVPDAPFETEPQLLEAHVARPSRATTR
jgi:hypothetical protein